jgi:hypothetical protein
MALVQSVTVGNRVIDLYDFQGDVVDEKKWATTQVSGSGGGCGINVGSGQPGMSLLLRQLRPTPNSLSAVTMARRWLLK